MGRVGQLVALILLGASLAALQGCSHGPKSGGGKWVVVQRGDTLWRLAERHGSTVAAIERANDDLDPRRLEIGRKLWIPREKTGRMPDLRHAKERPEPGECGELARRDGMSFEWPVLGELSSTYGGPRGTRTHEGIDVLAEEGTPIRAAESGEVVYAGDEIGDYGRVVIVKHASHWATVYAHNARNLVDEGERVGRGDVIAEVGETGNATGPHLHFEIRRSNYPEDPQSCLP